MPRQRAQRASDGIAGGTIPRLIDRRLAGLARSLAVTIDKPTQAALTAAGLGSVEAIAAASPRAVSQAIGSRLDAADLAKLTAGAVAQSTWLGNVLTGRRASLATGDLSSLNKGAKGPRPECDCEDCQSVASPLAYLAYLLTYAVAHVGTPAGTSVSTQLLCSLLGQPIADMSFDCASLEIQIGQPRICAEVLRARIAASPLPAQTQATLQSAEAGYLELAYSALLAGIGTSFDELRAARTASTDAREALAARIGLASANLDELVLSAEGSASGTGVLAESTLEELFGYADTGRDPLSTGPVIANPAKVLTRWRLDGIEWGRTTDSVGQIWVTVTHRPTQAQPNRYAITLAADKLGRRVVATGLGDASAGPIAVAGTDYGVTGSVTIHPARRPEQATVVGVPRALSWRLAAISARWALEDWPDDGLDGVPVIDPDVISVDDLRSSQSAAGALLASRASWEASYQTQIDAAAASSASDPTAGLFAFMAQPASYGSTTRTPWAGDEAALAQLWAQAQTPGGQDAAMAQLQSEYGLIAREAARLVGIATAAQAGTPAPASDTADACAIALQSLKRTFFDVWIEEEQAQAIKLGPADFWIALDEPDDQSAWLSPPGARPQWQRALLVHTRAVNVDPDVANVGDLHGPLGANPAYALGHRRALWEQQTAEELKQTRAAASDASAWLEQQLESTVGTGGAELDSLADQLSSGVSIDKRLAQLSLDVTGFALLQHLRALLSASVTVLDAEWADVDNLLIGVSKARLTRDWRDEEQTAGAVLSPAWFADPNDGETAAPPPSKAREAWQQRLGARYAERQSTLDDWWTMVSGVEQSVRPVLRDALVAAVGEYGARSGTVAAVNGATALLQLAQTELAQQSLNSSDTLEAAYAWLQTIPGLANPADAATVQFAAAEASVIHAAVDAVLGITQVIQGTPVGQYFTDAEAATAQALQQLSAGLTDLQSTLASDPVPLSEAAAALARQLHIDCTAGGCRTTTRAEQAIETLQDLLWSQRIGVDGGPSLVLDDDLFDEDWQWIGSYATWRAAMLVFLYPENVLLPTLRPWQSPPFRTLTALNAPSTPADACAGAAAYADYFDAIAQVEVQVTCRATAAVPAGPADQAASECSAATTEQRPLLFMFTAAGGQAYWATYDATMPAGAALSFWQAVPLPSDHDPITEVVAAVPRGKSPTSKVLLFLKARGSAGDSLLLTTYDLDVLSDDRWADTVTTLLLPDTPSSFSAVVEQSTDPTRALRAAVRSEADGAISVGTLRDDFAGFDTGSWQTIGKPGSVQTLRAFVAYDAVTSYLAADASNGTVMAIQLGYGSGPGASLAIPRVAVRQAADDSVAIWSSTGWDTTPGGVITADPGMFGNEDLSGSDVFAIVRSTSPDGTLDTRGSQSPNLSWHRTPLAIADLHGPEVVSWTTGTFAVFAWGHDGTLKSSPVTAESWQSFGGQLRSDPAATALPPPAEDQPWAQSINVFVLGTDYGIYQIVLDAQLHVKGGWSRLPGGPFTSGPAACWSAPSMQRLGEAALHVFARGTDNALWHLQGDGSSWGSWESLGGTMTSDPFAASNPILDTGQIDVYARGSNRDLIRISCVNGSWGGWSSLGGTLSDLKSIWMCDPSLDGWWDLTGWPEKVSTAAGDFTLWSGQTGSYLGAFQVSGGDVVFVWRQDADGTLHALSHGPSHDPVTIHLSGFDGVQTMAAGWSDTPGADTVDVAFQGTSTTPGAYHATVTIGGSGLSLNSDQQLVAPHLDATGLIGLALSSTDLLQRRADLEQVFANNGAAGDLPMSYLEEAFYSVPMLLGRLLNDSGYYEEALDWFRTVYDYARAAGDRKIYPGLIAEETEPTSYILPENWLADPLNPYLVAATRANTYTRATVLSIVRCLLDYSEAEFTKDTSETLQHARVLAQLALDLLDSENMDPAAGCVAPAVAPTLTWLDPQESPRSLPSVPQRSIGDVSTSSLSAAEAANATALKDKTLATTTTSVVTRAGDGALGKGGIGRFVPSVSPILCVPPNPELAAVRQRAQSILSKLACCLNVAGMRRPIATYAAPPGVADDSSQATGANSFQPTPYRYAALIDRAKQLTASAQQLEAGMLSALEKTDAETLSLLDAQNNAAVVHTQAQVQAARLLQAEQGVVSANLQQQRAQITVDQYQGLISAGLNQSEKDALGYYQNAAQLQASAAAVSAFGAIIGGIVGDIGAVLGGVSGALGSAAGAASDLAAYSSAEATYERRAQDWQYQLDLGRQDVAIGAAQIASAQTGVTVAQGDLAVANLQAAQADDVVRFLTTKFTNADLYNWMSGVLRGVYRFFLQQATTVAQLAAAQLSFERQEVLPPFIQTDYWQPPQATTSSTAGAASTTSPQDTSGLTGAERLLEDITRLDEYAFDTDQRKLQLTRTISLANLDPFAFQTFRQTGVLAFTTPTSLFDRDFPGHYLRLIQTVRTSIIALVPPVEGVRAELANTGISRVVVPRTGFDQISICRDPEQIALVSPTNATGVFNVDPQSNLALPFEGLGVDTSWQLVLPRAANQFDFNTIADVLFSIDYTALRDDGLRQRVIRGFDGTTAGDRSFSMRQDLLDQWWELNNPDQSLTPMTVTFRTEASDFPANVLDPTIANVCLYIASSTSTVIESALTLTFTPDLAMNLGALGGSATTAEGVVSTRAGTGTSWLFMVGESVVGEWSLSLPDDTATRALFGQGAVADIMLLVSYSGELPPWP